MTAPRTSRAAFAVAGALSLIILTAAPAPALAADHRELGGAKLQGQKAVGPDSSAPQPSLPAGQKVAPGALPSASGLPTGKRQHKPVMMMNEPPSGASSKALHKIPAHNPPWSNPKLHGEGLPEPGMVHPPDPINPTSKVGGITPDDSMPASQAASGEGLATMGGQTAVGIRTEQLNNKYPENMR